MEVAVYGYGNIGSGVVQIIEKNQDTVAKAIGENVHVKYVLDLREFEGDPIHDRVVHDVDIIVNDPEIKIVCETMGGNEPAFTFTKKALEAGKSVCTSNKELVANHGEELMKIAAEHNCNYFYEASVGGGIPVIRTINNALLQEHIVNISGIVNGTTNYILTKMDKEGAAFDDVLKKAQELGYAERNPEADVEGYDACRKIAILSSLMSGKSVDFKDIYTEGITKITAEDFMYMKKMNATIKLLAMAKDINGRYLAMVSPFVIYQSHPLYSVNDVFNGVFVKGDMLGDSMYYGAGAGKLPTASAVIADVIEAGKNMGVNLKQRWEGGSVELLDYSTTEKKFFVRLKKASVDAAKAEAVFGAGQVVEVAELAEEFAFVTPVMSEKDFAAKAESLGDAVITRVRIEE